MPKIVTFKYNKDNFDEIKNYNFGRNWPVVYVLEDKKEIYIGQTVNAYYRSRQHYENPESYELLDLNGQNYDKVKKYWEKLEQYGYSEEFELETICNQISSNQNLGIPAIIFVLSKKKCEKMAQNIKETSYVSVQESESAIKFFDSNLREFKNCSQYVEMRKVVSRGIGYHHSGLIPKIREVVEFLIKNKLIKIVFATETFAVGLNFPVKTVVITSLKKPTQNGFRFLTTSEYKQMAGRAGRRFLDPFGNVILMLFNPKSKLAYPAWSDINLIVNGNPNSVKSKYVIEPNYVLKNIMNSSYSIVGLKSFKYYKDGVPNRNITCNEKYLKLFDIDKKQREFAKNGIGYKDKNYQKMLSKLTPNEKIEYQEFLKKYDDSFRKTDLELYLELENKIVEFLKDSGYIIKTKSDFDLDLDSDKNTIKNSWKLTQKGLMACNFTEINPIIFMDNIDKIFSNSSVSICVLSMFIDDGIKIRNDEIIIWEEIEPEIIYWENAVKKYEKFIGIFPKWTFYPKNYIAIKEWLENPDMSLDQIAQNYDIDLGLFVKILMKVYQIMNELIPKLDKLNQSDLTKKFSEQKELLSSLCNFEKLSNLGKTEIGRASCRERVSSPV